jgi:hypothetical protein
MGEMADALIDEGVCGDDFEGFGARACRDAPRKLKKVCWFCGAKDLHWVKQRNGPNAKDEKWRLADKDDNIHDCGHLPKPMAFDQSKLKNKET